MKSALSIAFLSQGLSSGSSLSITAALLFIPTVDKKKKKLQLFWSFLKTKGLGEEPGICSGVKVRTIFCLVLKQRGRGKKVNFKTIIEAKPKPASPSVYYFTGGASLSHVSGLIIFYDAQSN